MKQIRLFPELLTIVFFLSGCSSDRSHECYVTSMPQDTTVATIRLSELVDTNSIGLYPTFSHGITVYGISDKRIGVITVDYEMAYTLDKNSGTKTDINIPCDFRPMDIRFDNDSEKLFLMHGNGFLAQYNVSGDSMQQYIATDMYSRVFTNEDNSLTLLNAIFRNTRPHFDAATVEFQEGIAPKIHRNYFPNLREKSGLPYFFCNTGQTSFGWTDCDTLFYYDPNGHNLYPRFVINLPEPRPSIVITVELKDRFLTKLWSNPNIVETDKKTGNSRYVRIENDLKLDSSPTIDPEAFKDGYYSFMTAMDNIDRPLDFPPKEDDNKVLVVVPLKKKN